MSDLNLRGQVAFVIASCDKYSDLWEPLFGQIFKHWPDNSYQIYLIANHKKFNHPRVVTLLAGDDLDWSSTVIHSINQLTEQYVLFWVDDAFLSEDVDVDRVNTLVTWIVDGDHNFLRMRPNPRPKSWLRNDIGILDHKQAYRVSLFSTLWKMDILKEILRQGESAWQFEVDGSARSQKFEHFYCTRDEVFKYWHGVERGIWILPTVNQLRQLGFTIDGTQRRIMTTAQNIGHQYRVFKSWVLHQIPEQRRSTALRLARAFYYLLGLRKP